MGKTLDKKCEERRARRFKDIIDPGMSMRAFADHHRESTLKKRRKAAADAVAEIRRKKREYQRAWIKANPEKANEMRQRYNDKTLAKRLGSTPATRDRPKTCECCGREPHGRCGKGNATRLSFDHCHVTRAFRGWLCNNCNAGIGLLGDSYEGLVNAILYLHRVKHNLIGDLNG